MGCGALVPWLSISRERDPAQNAQNQAMHYWKLEACVHHYCMPCHTKCHTKGPGSIPDSKPHLRWRNQWMVQACKEHSEYAGSEYGCHAAFAEAARAPTPAPPTPAPTMSKGERQEAALMAALTNTALRANAHSP